MSAFDFSPLFRGTVGFDRLARMMDVTGANAQTYPPSRIVAMSFCEPRS